MTRPLLVALALAALAAPLRAQPAHHIIIEPPPGADPLAAARDAYRRGDFVKARELLLEAYQLVPQREVLFALGQTEFNLGHYKEAIDYYQRFMATDPAADQSALAEQAIGAARMKLAAPPPPPPARVVPPPPPHVEWDGFDTGLTIAGGVAALGGGAMFYESAHLAGDRSGNLHNYDTRVHDAHLARTFGIASTAAGALAIGGALLRWRLHLVETTVSIDAGPTRVGISVEHRL
ncbi:MAG TPA: tetratricopeptide repeat protein [Kofleriaceae bacterium]